MRVSRGRELRKSALACAVGRCKSCGGGLIRGGIVCECWCHRRGGGEHRDTQKEIVARQQVAREETG